MFLFAYLTFYSPSESDVGVLRCSSIRQLQGIQQPKDFSSLILSLVTLQKRAYCLDIT